MADSSSYPSINCKSCKKSLMGVEELIIMFDHIRSHDSKHFRVPAITKLVDHFEKVCEKFKGNTSHDEAEQLVRFSITNLLDYDTKKFSVFNMNKEMLDYIHYKKIVS